MSARTDASRVDPVPAVDPVSEANGFVVYPSCSDQATSPPPVAPAGEGLIDLIAELHDRVQAGRSMGLGAVSIANGILAQYADRLIDAGLAGLPEPDPIPPDLLARLEQVRLTARAEMRLAALLARVVQLQAQVEMMDACLIRDDSLMECAEKAEHEKVELFDAVQDMKRRLKSERERADRAEQDAARYRFLRSRLTDGGTMYDPANHRRHVSLRLPVNIGAYFPSGTDAISADAIIDAARTPAPTTTTTEPTDAE